MPRKPRTKRSRKQRYFAQVARLRIETVYVEFEASDDEAANRRAVALAKARSETEWVTDIVDDAPHVQCILSEVDLRAIDEESSDPLGGPEEAVSEGAGALRYALLRADVETGEGDVILQPWLPIERNNLLTSDIVGDWIGELQALDVDGLNHHASELMSRSRPGAGQLTSGPRKPADLDNVVPMKRRRPKPPRDDDDGPESA